MKCRLQKLYYCWWRWATSLRFIRENDSIISQLSWQPRSLEFGCQLSNHIVSTWHNRVCFPAREFNCVSTGGHWNVEESDCTLELKEFRFLPDTCAYRVVQEEEKCVRGWVGTAMKARYKYQLYGILCCVLVDVNFMFCGIQRLELKYCKSRSSLETAQATFCTKSWTKDASRGRGLWWSVIFEWSACLILDAYTCSCLH